MFAQRALVRASPRLRLARAPLRRRMYSSESPKQFAGAEDNEFNRERARIQEHAAESGGKCRDRLLRGRLPAVRAPC